MGTSNSADIGIRIFLDDAANAGLRMVNGNLANMENLTKRAGLGFGSMSKNLVGLGIVAGLAAAFLLFGGAIVYSVDQGSKLQQTLLRIQVATSATSAEMLRMQAYIISVAGTSIYSVDQLAQGFVLLGQRGFTATEIMNGMGTAGKNLAEAIKVSPVVAFTLLANTMNAFGAKAKDAAHFADLLQFSMEHSTFQAQGMTAALAKIGPVAAALREPTNEFMVALDVTARAMGNMNTAGTGLYYFLRQLAAPATAKAAAEFQKLGISLFDSKGKAMDLAGVIDELAHKMAGMSDKDKFAALSTMFGTRASQGILALINHVKSFDDLLKQLKKTHDNLGGAAHYAQMQEDSFSGAVQAAKTNVQSLAGILGLSLLPTLTPIAKGIRDFVQHLIDISNTSPKMFTSVLLIGAALAGVGLIVAVALSPFALLIGIMVAVVAIVAGLAVGITWLAAKWAWLRNQTGDVGIAMYYVGKVLGALGGIFNDIVALIRDQFITVWTEMKAAFKDAAPEIAAIVPFLKQLGMILLLVFGAAVVGLIHAFIGAIAAVLVGVTHLITGIIGILGGIINILKGFGMIIVGIMHGNGAMISQGWNMLWTGVAQFFKGILNVIIGLVYTLFGSILAFVLHFIGGIISYFTNLANALVGHSIIPNMLKAMLTAFVTFFANIISAVASLVSGVIAKIVAFAANLVAHIQAGINLVKALWSAGWALLIALFIAFVVNVLVHILVLKAQIQQHFTDAMNGAKTAVSTGIATVLKFFTDLPGKIKAVFAGAGQWLVQAGKNIVQGIIDGIMAMIGAIIRAAQAVASAIASHMPHKSPADEGPLRDINKWMPTMMKMMAQSAEDNMPIIDMMSSRIAARIAHASAGGGGGGGGNSTHQYNLNLDGQTLASWL